MGFYEKSDFQMLASLWLKQQDLTGKSLIEIAELYYNAITELQEKYQYEIANQNMERMICE